MGHILLAILVMIATIIGLVVRYDQSWMTASVIAGTAIAAYFIGHSDGFEKGKWVG